MNERLLTVFLVTSFILLATVKLTSSCNQMLCASVVSKCMLTQVSRKEQDKVRTRFNKSLLSRALSSNVNVTRKRVRAATIAYNV
jgi:hypothetical protein